MSLTSAMTESSTLKCSVLLRTADQYPIWKSRVTDACWAATHKDVFAITDEDCKIAVGDFEAAATAKMAKKKGEAPVGPPDWVGKCWMIITSALHDDVYSKISHVRRGAIQSLLGEIQQALVVNNMEEVAPLRLELYGGTMQKDANNDLQTWISFMKERSNKLTFLKKPVDEAELVSIYLKGLHSTFQQLQVYFAIPGQLPTTLDEAITITRKFATNPAVAAELAKLKSSGTSQAMFPLTAQVPRAPKSKPLCKQFARNGTCTYGSNCRFLHTTTPGPRPTCAFCQNLGHTIEVCRKRLAQQQNASAPAQTPATALLSAPPQPALVSNGQINAMVSTAADPLMFVFTVSTQSGTANWVLDSGATCCATFSEDDCVDVKDCEINVTAVHSLCNALVLPSSRRKTKLVKLCVSKCGTR
jgi:hypothetical protein